MAKKKETKLYFNDKMRGNGAPIYFNDEMRGVNPESSSYGSDSLVETDRRNREAAVKAGREARLRAIELAKANGSTSQSNANAGNDRTTALRISEPKKDYSGLGTLSIYRGMNEAANGANVDQDNFRTEAATQNGWKGLNGTSIAKQIKGNGVTEAESLKHAEDVMSKYKFSDKAMSILDEYVAKDDESKRGGLWRFESLGSYSGALMNLGDKFKAETGVSDEEFTKIFESYSRLKHAEEREQQQQEYADMGNGERVAKSIVKAPKNVLGGYQALIGSLQNPSDPELGRDYNSEFFRYSNENTDIRKAQNDAIDKIEDPVVRTLAHYGYNAGVMGVESATAALTGEAGLGSFFAGGYSSGLKEAEDRGLSPEQSQAYALAVGSLEYFTERIPWEGLKNIWAGKAVSKDAVKGSIMPYIKALFKQKGSEALEEVINGVGDIIADGLISGDKSKLNNSIQYYVQEEGLSEEEATSKAIWDVIKETADAAITASISAGVSAGPALANQAYTVTKVGRNIADYENKTGNLTKNVENADYISENREDYVADEDYRQAQETRQAILAASEKAAKGERITGREARALAELYGQTADNLRAAQKVEEAKLIESARAKAEEKAIEQIKEASTPAEVETIKEENINSEAVKTAVEEKKAEMIEAGKATEAEFTEAITPTKAAAMAESGETIEQEVLEQLPEKVQQAYETGKADQANKLTSDVTKTDINTIELTDESGKKSYSDIKSVSQNSKGEIVFELSNGESVKAAEAGYTPKGKYLYNSPNGINSLDNPVLVQTAINIEQNSKHGVPVGSVTLALKDMYTMGAAGLDFDQAIKSRDFDLKTLGKENLRAAYDEGKKNSTATSRATYAKKGKGLIKEGTAENKEAYNSQFADEKARSEYENHLSEANKEFLELFSKKIGVDIAFFNENSQDRGSYRPDEGKIYLNLYHSHNMFNVALHEGIGEFMAASNEKAYNEIVNSVLNAYAATNSTQLASDIRAYQEAYAGDKFGGTYKGASQELFNDVLSDMFSSNENMKKLFDWMVTNEGVEQAQKVKKTFADYFKSVKDAIHDVLTKGVVSTVEERKLKMSEKEATTYVDRILKAMDQAIANRDAGVVQQGESAARYSIKTVKGKSGKIYENCVVLDSPLFMFKSKRTWTARYKDFIIDNLAGRFIDLYDENGNGRKYYVANENDRVKKDTANNKGHKVISKLTNTDISLEKKRIFAHILEVAEVSEFTKENFDHNHQWMDENGWEFRTSYVRDIDGKIYSVLLNIARGDTRDILYDITKIDEVDWDTVASVTKSNGPVTTANFMNRIPSKNKKATPKQPKSAQTIVKKAKKKGRRSIEVNVPVSANDEVVAIHNTTAAQLLETIKLGGFPSPSIAIVKADMSHEKYGEVSVVFGRETVDPEYIKANNIYGGDAWTAVVPTIEFEINDNKIKELSQYLDNNLPAELRNLGGYDGLDKQNSIEALRRGDIINSHYGRDPKFRYLFITSKDGLNQDVTIPKKVTTGRSNFDEDQVKLLADTFGEKVLSEAVDSSEKAIELTDKIIETLNKFKFDKYMSEHTEEEFNALPVFRQNYLKDFYKRDKWTLTRTENLIHDALEYIHNGGFLEVNDDYALRDKLDEIVDANYDAYTNWLVKLFDGVFLRQGIRNDKEAYDSRGRERSWDELHEDVTLENIVKVMNSQEDQGATGLFSQSVIQALATKRFKSIDDMKASINQLKMMPDEEYKAEKEKYYSQYNDIITEIYDRKQDNDFIARQQASDAIAEALKAGKTEKNIDRELRSWGSLNVKPDTAKKIVKLINDMAEMATGYFEAKPKRAVNFDEILNVVTPDTSTELIDALKENNIPYETYKEGDELARKHAVNNTAGARFSIGGIGAQTADMMALTEADDMRAAGKSMEEIFAKTGWYMGNDDKWRFEISNKNAEVFTNGAAKFADTDDYKQYKADIDYINTAEVDDKWIEAYERSFKYSNEHNLAKEEHRLDEILKHDELFEAYPSLARMKVAFEKLDGGTNGRYNPKTNSIELNKDFKIDTSNRLKRTLFHEIQHAIQKLEGFANGASPEFWGVRGTPEVITEESTKAYEDAKAKVEDIRNKLPEEFIKKYDKYTELLAKAGGLNINWEYQKAADNLYKELEEENEEALQELDDATFEADLKFPMGTPMLPSEAYYATAGEIEAREVSDRINMTDEERRANLPKMTDENGRVVFAENATTPWRYPTGDDIRFSKKVDAEYNQALENDDFEKMQQAIEQAARTAGFDSPMLYHGTQDFGFTKIDLSKMDDSTTIFATDDPEIAGTYSAGEKEAKQIIDKTKDFSKLSMPEIAKLLNNSTPDVDEIKYEYYPASYISGLGQKISKELQVLKMQLNNELSKRVPFDYGKTLRDFLNKESIDNILHKKENGIHELGADFRRWLYVYITEENADSKLKNLYSDIKKYIKLEEGSYGGKADVIWKDNGFYQKTTVLDRVAAERELKSKANYGIYQLYGKLGKTLEIDCQGMLWNTLQEVSKEQLGVELRRTRDITKYAKENGYDSVIFKNIIDNGGASWLPKKPTNVYAFFRPNDIKSADPITYDEDGNVIPPSERFDTSNDDIRYSISVGEDRIHTYKGIEIVQNPTNREYQQMRADIIKERPWMDGPDTILLRHTYDEEGNTYYWDAYAGMHRDIEPAIAEHWKTRVNQQWEWWKDDDKDFWANRSFSRYSKAVFGEESQYSSQLEQTQFVSQILSTLNNQLKGTTVSMKYIDETVKYILDKYDADLNPDDFKMELSQFIAYMTANEQVDYNQMMNYLLNVGDEVIQASRLKDPEEERIYSELKKELSSHKINLTEVERKELISKYGGSWNAVFGKLNAAGIKLNNAGQHMDGSTYAEIVDRFREIAGVQLDEEKTAVDQIATILDAMDALKPSAYQWEGATDMDKALDVATTIIDRYYSMATAIKESNIVKGTEKGAAAVERAKKNEIKKLRAKQEEYKAKVNEEFQQLVEDRKKVIQEQQEFYKRQAEIEKNFRGEKREFNKKANMTSKELEKTARLQAQVAYQGLKDTEAKKKNKDNIVRTCMRLINWMNKPTDTRHVPTFLKPALSDMIKSINFMPASMRKGDDGTISAIKWQESMRKLQQVIQGISTADGENINDSDKYELSLVMEADEIVNKMQQLLDKYGGTADISRMSKDDLKVLSDIMTAISKGISQMNENFMNRRFKHVSEAAVASMNEMNELKPISNTMGFAKSTLSDFLNLDMAEPITFFEELGSASESIMQEFFDGEKIGIEIIEEADKFFDTLAKDLKLSKKEIRSWENDAKEYKFGNVPITLTSADLMSLYCSYNREKLDQEERPFEATHHIAAGGIKGFRHRIGFKEVNRNPQVAHVNEAEVLRLLDNLTETQKQYADMVVKYMSTTLAEHGNKTSNKLNGYSKFLGKYYFPLKTDTNAIATTESNNTSDQAAFRRLIFPSFTKSQIDKADNALVIMNFFDVVTEHITGMSNYCAYAMPISDAMRWYNYAETERANTEVEDQYQRYTTSVKGAMDRVRGEEARKYFEQFIRDVNLDNKASGSKASKLISQGLTGLAKAKAVGLNVRVILQQPCAIIRAADVIEGKYLAEGWAKMSKNPKAAAEYAQKESYLCYWKSKGFSDTRVSQSMKEIITGQESLRQEIVEKTGLPAGLADDVTWAAMYYAAEAKIEATTDLQKGTEEFHTAVEELFSDIINHTQVIDSNLRKTGTMRSNDAIEKLANAFKKEPQKTYNMLHRAYWNKVQAEYQGNKFEIVEAENNLKKTFIVFVITAFGTALAQSPVDAWRDDDDEDSYLMKMIKKMLPYDSYATVRDFVDSIMKGEVKAKDVLGLIQGIYGGAGNILDNANIASSVPYIADIDSLLKGYSVTRLDSTSILTQLKNTVTTLGSTNATPYSIIYSLAQLVGYATGIGADNALRDLRGIYNQFLSDMTGVRIEKNAATAKKNAKKKETNRVSEVFDSNDLSSIKAEIKTAYDKGIESSKDGSESDGWTAARNMLKEQYKRFLTEHPEDKATLNNRFKSLLKNTKKADGKGGYRTLTDKEIQNYIDNWSAAE